MPKKQISTKLYKNEDSEKISKVIVIVMAVLATIWCGLYVYANYFYNDKQIDVENFYIAELPLPPRSLKKISKKYTRLSWRIIHYTKPSI